MWPFLFDPLLQLYFTDAWHYPVAAILLSMGAPDEVTVTVV